MHRFPNFPVPEGRFWAKLHPFKNPEIWHPLIAHSADVAAVLARMISPESILAKRLAVQLGQEALAPGQRARLVFLAALHDMGKVNHGFQTKARPMGERGDWVSSQRGHVKVLLESMGVPGLRRMVTENILAVLGTDGRAAAGLWAGTISHHGRPWMPEVVPKRGALWHPDASGRDPLGEAQRLIDHAAGWSGVAHTPDETLLPVPPAFTHLFAGVLTLADWIGSTRSAFPFAPSADEEPDRYWDEEARPRAELACARIGVVPRTRPVSLSGLSLLGQLFPDVFRDDSRQPTELQQHVAEMALPVPGARLLIESETGSGKTEAALALYARLREVGRVGGLMFALPTRATASAMHGRVVDAMKGMYQGEEHPTITLAVGGQQPRTGSSEALVNEQPLTYPDTAERELENWASSHNKKFLAAEVVVGTVDQVLLAGLPVKHAHLRLAALSRHLLVVDELHSYDRYMTEVLRRVLELHTQAGGIALFMSATLSDAARTLFASQTSTPGSTQTYTQEQATRVAYPALALCEAAHAEWEFTSLASSGEPKRVQWRATSSEGALRTAVDAAASGARVLVLRNTVTGARDAIRWFVGNPEGKLLWRPAGSEHAPPYHSRYTLPDRLALDRAVTERFGKPAAQVPGGAILVATQVAEQSLDVDFDLLITDLCPIDVLLQRIGRLHRHRERHPYRPEGYRAAGVSVIAPDGGFAQQLRKRSLSLGWGENRPYSSYADGELTLRLIQGTGNGEIVIPRDNRALVEGVYHAEARDPLWADPLWEEYMCKAEGAERNRAWMGDQAALAFDRSYTASAGQFSDAQERAVRTRLGDDTIRIDLPEPVRCWYASPAEPVLTVDLPLWALPQNDDGTLVTSDPIWEPAENGASGFRLGKRSYRYGPLGWEWGR